MVLIFLFCILYAGHLLRTRMFENFRAQITLIFHTVNFENVDMFCNSTMRGSILKVLRVVVCII